MQIKINAETIDIPSETTLADILIEKGYTQHCFAIAINRRFIPSAQYATTVLQQQDEIEIVAPMQGG